MLYFCSDQAKVKRPKTLFLNPSIHRIQGLAFILKINKKLQFVGMQQHALPKRGQREQGPNVRLQEL